MNTEETIISNRLEEENRRLRAAVEELSILNDIATAITSTQSIEQIIELIVKKCVKYLKVEQGAVMLLDEKDQQNPFHTMIRKQDSISNLLPFRLDAQLTGWMLKNKNPLMINNFESDPRFNFVSRLNQSLNEKNFPVKSLLSVPMLLKGKLIGLLTVFNKHTLTGFTNDDQRLLGIIAAQSAHVVENARLYHEEQALIHLQEEMKLAYEIQVDLLPKSQPEIKGYQIAGKSIPAKEVGGDYFDFISIDDNHLAFCVGDISGKGIPAALLMANLQATLRGQTSFGKSCKDCIFFTNNMLFHSTASNKFATLFYAILNSETNQITYCNAGHNNPYLIAADGKMTKLSVGGIIVGIMAEAQYDESIIDINPGEFLILFSDGITEAMNSAEEEFGDKRLTDIVLNNRKESVENIIDIIFREVKLFVGNSPQMDDMTVVIVKREI
ncbi:MAG: GAF domain-containing SpoIIE family protein phosphatase [Ignavibacteria bacterium]